MAIFKHYLPLCWFRKNPYALEDSLGFLKKNLVYFFIVQFFLQANMTDDPGESFVEVILEIIVSLLFIGLMLLLNGTSYAFIRMANAFFFGMNAVSFLVIPILIWLTVSENIVSYYLLALTGAWAYMIVTYIIKRTLLINTAASMVLSLTYFATTYYGAFALGQLL
ncbi:hypothetical protein JCM14076_30720 [Methylosoma difficile]